MSNNIVYYLLKWLLKNEVARVKQSIGLQWGEMIDSFWLLLYIGDVIFKSTNGKKNNKHLMPKSARGWSVLWVCVGTI